MDLQVEDIIRMNVVLVGTQLLTSPVEKDAFSVSVNAEVTEAITGGFTVSLGPTGISAQQPSIPQPRLLTLQKERITLDLAPGLSTIFRDYPTKIEIERLAEVANLAISHSDLNTQTLQAFGFNLEAVCGLPYGKMFDGFLASSIYAPNITDNSCFRLTGGSTKMTFQNESGQWNVGLEPRFGDVASSKLFMTLNLHIASQAMPTRDEIHSSLHSTWEHVRIFANIFSGRE